MELKEGYMTLKELSIWFGLKPDTIGKSKPSSKEKRLKLLKTYAEYHFEGKRLYIDRVIYPTYTKAFEIIDEEMPKRWGKIKDKNGQINEVLYKERIDTCARVGEDIWRNIKEVHTQISLNTAKVYTNNSKVKHYGHNHLADRGDLGRSEYIWTNERGTAPLNEEELKILKECAATAYGNVDVLIAAIDDDYKNGILTKEERDAAVGAIETADSYDLFVNLVINRLGYYPKKRTQLIDEKDWAEEQ